MVDVPLGELTGYIDWTFFFTAWELKGRYPEILEHPRYGQAARELFEHAQPILARIVREGLLRARGVYGYWPAASEDNDIVLYADEARTSELARFPMLRQQREKGDADPHYCLADFVAPAGDYVGAFAVTAGLGAAELVREYEAGHDDYSAIIVKALADRLAEALAELLHERVRREWYAPDERLTNEQRIAEDYRGIRPALGYPACPDHTDKPRLFELLGAREVGMDLTETFAMTPAASVSGLYLAHPGARYFSVGKIDRAQVEDYARRKGMSVAEVERYLGSILGYDPAAAGRDAAA
ncbi:MAG: hypothetical protein M5U28_33330 [Sandaracinaceae bacterium]|nr:hypothetical protein [Sandaracinaceae bacterium]